MRVGWGYDAHRFGEGSGRLVLGGVDVPGPPVEATSDGDVAVHALIDALLGATASGDLGAWFPSTDAEWHGADSVDLLRRVVDHITTQGFRIVSVDITIVAESVRVAPRRDAMRQALSSAMAIDVDRVSVKATTTDGLGWIGRGEGMAASAVAVVDD